MKTEKGNIPLNERQVSDRLRTAPKKTSSPKKEKSGKGSILLIIAVTTVIMLVIFVLSTFYSPTGKSEITGDENQTAGVTKADYSKSSFPLSFPSGIDDVAATNSLLYILSHNTVTSYDLSGTKSTENVFNFASLAMKTKQSYAIVYDRQGINFAVMNKDKIIFEGKNEDGEYINNAFICDNGNFLIASRTSKGSGMLTYYDRSGKILFQWLCANEYIVNCAASDNYGNLVCSAVGAKSGEIYTKLYYFDIDKSENNKEYTFEGTACLDCFFVGNRNVIAVCQDRRILIDFSKSDYKPVEKEYGSGILKQASDENGNTAVLIKKEDSFDKTILKMYDSHNNISSEYELPDNIKDICVQSSKTYVLSDDAVYKADRKVEKITDLTAVNNHITVGSRRIYYYTSSVLSRLE